MNISNINKLEEANPKILVIGDIILDVYYFGNADRLSPEAPVPVFNYKRVEKRLGGAANVLANARMITDHVNIMTVIGSDYEGKEVQKLLGEFNIDQNLVLIDNSRRTTVKQRYIAQNNQQLFRVDLEDRFAISESVQKDAIERLGAVLHYYDIVLISDYAKGFLPAVFLQKIITLCNENSIKTIVDVKGTDYKKYVNSYVIKPNEKELSEMTGIIFHAADDIKKAAISLLEATSAKYIITTLGKNGMLIVGDNGMVEHIVSEAKDVFDVTGAGDTVLSYLGGCIAADLSIEDSVEIANAAAGIQVSKMGTSTVSIEEIERQYNRSTTKIMNINQIHSLAVKLHEQNKKIVFTNGCFDILHIGHTRYLAEASKYGDILIVGINSDNSIKRLKGESRPIICQEDRLEIMTMLEVVDYVVMFDDDTPLELIKAINPDVLVKGADWKKENIVGADIVTNNGGRVELIGYIDNHSTTNIVNKMSK